MKYPGNVRKLPGNVREISRKCTGNFREISGTFPRNFREMSETFPGHFREIPGKFPGNVRAHSGKIPGHVRDISAKFPGNFRPGPPTTFTFRSPYSLARRVATLSHLTACQRIVSSLCSQLATGRLPGRFRKNPCCFHLYKNPEITGSHL